MWDNLEGAGTQRRGEGSNCGGVRAEGKGGRGSEDRRQRRDGADAVELLIACLWCWLVARGTNSLEALLIEAFSYCNCTSKGRSTKSVTKSLASDPYALFSLSLHQRARLTVHSPNCNAV